MGAIRPVTAALALDPDAPWEWSMRDLLGLLSQRQKRYVELLPRVFRVKQASGRVVPYALQPYQAWFHAHSPLAMGSAAPNRIVEKGRGIGLTLMDAMDSLMLAHARSRVKIPVAGRQAETGDEFIEKAWDLIRDSTAENDEGIMEPFFDADPNVTSLVRLGNGSSIIPVAGGNPNAFRGKRAPKASLDEYAFHPHPEETWRAVRGVLSEGGQLTVLSTHDGADTHFYDLVEKAKTGALGPGWKLFTFPIHTRDFDDARPISMQVHEGRVRLVAPWLNLGVLDTFLAEDPHGYRQENLAETMDEQINLISGQVAEDAHDPTILDWERPVSLDDLQHLHGTQEDLSLVERLILERATVATRPLRNPNPVAVSVDFASAGDLSAWTALEETPDGSVQRYLLVLRGVPTPVQNALLRILEQTLRPTSVAIDMTGPGTGLYEHAVHDLSCEVHGVNFGSKIKVEPEEDGQYVAAPPKVPIKKAMALNLDHVLRTQQLSLLGAHALAGLQKKHLRAIRRKDLDAPRRAGEGHADIFWALAMAAYASRLQPSYRTMLVG